MTALFEVFGGSGDGWLALLLEISVKTALVLVAALAATRALHRHSASVRHHVWTLAFAAALSLPALVVTVPSWQVMIPGLTASARAGGAAETVGATAFAPAPSSGVARLGDAAALGPERSAARGDAGVPSESVTRAPTLGVRGAALPPASVASSEPLRPGSGPSAGALLLGLWGFGAALLSIKLGVGVVSAWWTSRVSNPIRDRGWIETVEELRAELGIPGPVRVVRSDWVGSPMAWGILRTALLLPPDAETWGAERRRAVALHELAHIKRRDCLTHLIAEAARALHWFNPLAWLGTRRLRAERERACDDLVLSAGTRSADYARLLLDVARSRGDRRLGWAAVSMANGSELEGRLLAILDPSRDRRGAGVPGRVAAGLASLGLVVPLAAFQAAPTPVPLPPLEAPRASAGIAAPAAPPGPGPGTILAPVAIAAPGGPAASETTPLPRVAPASVVSPVPEVSLRAWHGSTPAPGVLPVPPRAGPGGAAPDPWLAVARADTIDQRVIDALLRALENDHPGVRSEAARALGRAEVASAAGALSRALRDDASSAVRAEAAWALGMIESTAGVPALVRGVADEAASVRAQSAWALGMIEDTDGVAALGTALTDENAEVREQAVWALGMIEDAAAVPVLRTALTDENADVRGEAAWALGMIESPEAVTALIDALTDESARVRAQAAWALGMIADESATDALIDAIEDESEEVGKQAMWALGRVIDG